MLVLDAETVERNLPYAQLVAALREAHRSPLPPQIRTIVSSDPSGRGNDFLALTAWAPEDMIAAKLVSVFPGNLASTPARPCRASSSSSTGTMDRSDWSPTARP